MRQQEVYLCVGNYTPTESYPNGQTHSARAQQQYDKSLIAYVVETTGQQPLPSLEYGATDGVAAPFC